MELSSNYEELSFFQQQKDEVLKDFVEIAYEFLTNDRARHRSHVHAAAKLNIETAQVEKLIGKLTELLLESVRIKLNQTEFVQSLEPVIGNHSKILQIWEIINLKRDSLTQVLSKSEINYAQFASLNWRLDHTVASKSLGSFSETNFLLELKLRNRHSNKITYFLSDIPNLYHMTDLLESALLETKSSHIRNIQN